MSLHVLLIRWAFAWVLGNITLMMIIASGMV